jgi:integrase
MASISTSANGTRTVQFVSPADGVRRTIHLGTMPMRNAQEVKRRVEYLVAALGSGTAVDGDTAKWLGDISDDLHARLARVGLTAPRLRAGAGMGEFTAAYITSRADVKPRTVLNLQACAARLVEFFGADRQMQDVSPGQADEFCAWLRGRYAQATAARTIKRAKQFFKAARRKDLISRNPFEECKAGHQHNKARAFFVTQDAAGKVLAACPDHQWRVLFALARFGGLRCPSETLNLEWADVDWEKNRFRVRSPKQERHESGGERWVPIFPELRPHLAEAFELAEPGTVHVVTRYRDTSVNLRTGLCRIIRRAGLETWERPWHNLRATRQTELSAQFPLHVVCYWMGNQQAVAAEHYLQVTDADYERAAKSAARALHNQVQPVAVLSREDSSDQQKTPEKPGVSQGITDSHGMLPTDPLPPRGLEPLLGA